MARLGVAAIAVLLLAGVRPADGQVQIDLNRPHSPFECDTPIGERW